MTLESYDAHHVGHGHGRSEPVVIPDNRLTDKEVVLVPAHYKEDLAGVLIPRGLIRDRIERLAADIRAFYGGEPVHIVCVLKGSRGFFGELIKVLNSMRLYEAEGVAKIAPPFFEYYVRLKKDPNHPGHVHAISDDLSPLIGKNVLVVEDMINTGLTLSRFCRQLLDMKVKTVRVAALLERRKTENPPTSPKKTTIFKADFVGFSVPDRFIVGFCLDHNEKYRDLQHLAVLNDDARIRE
jgi:hypoxanthine phosphoribosyltransferase